MFDSIKKMLGMKKKRKARHVSNGAFVVSNYPEQGWTIKNPSFFYHGSWHTISWIKIADYQAHGTDQFVKRALPMGMFNYNGLHMEEFVNCGITLEGAQDAKEELENFVNALSDAKEAKILVRHKEKEIEINLSKIHMSASPVLKTIGPRGGKKKGYMDELDLDEKGMEKVCNEMIVR